MLSSGDARSWLRRVGPFLNIENSIINPSSKLSFGRSELLISVAPGPPIGLPLGRGRRGGVGLRAFLSSPIFKDPTLQTYRVQCGHSPHYSRVVHKSQSLSSSLRSLSCLISSKFFKQCGAEFECQDVKRVGKLGSEG